MLAGPDGGAPACVRAMTAIVAVIAVAASLLSNGCVGSKCDTCQGSLCETCLAGEPPLLDASQADVDAGGD
jgi:hypothetical protein